MPNRRSPTRRSRAPRSRTGWHGLVTDPTSLAAGATTFVNFTTLLLDVATSPLFKQGLTLLRTFLTMRANSTDATLSAESAHGLIMADGDQVATGIFPSLFTDLDAPWLHWERRVLLPASDSEQHLRRDIKAKRRFKGNDEALIFLISNDDAAQALEFSLGVRMLFKLP